MTEYRDVTPIPGPEAFRERGRDTRLSQAAIVLAAGAAMGGEMYRLDEPSALDLPEDLGRIGRQRKLRVEQAAGPLDIDLSTHLDHPELRLPPSTSVEITRRLFDRPQAVTAAALVEANLHSDSRLVRTAAAVAAVDTTGPREDVLARLVEGAGRCRAGQVIGSLPTLPDRRGRPPPPDTAGLASEGPGLLRHRRGLQRRHRSD